MGLLRRSVVVLVVEIPWQTALVHNLPASQIRTGTVKNFRTLPSDSVRSGSASFPRARSSWHRRTCTATRCQLWPGSASDTHETSFCTRQYSCRWSPTGPSSRRPRYRRLVRSWSTSASAQTARSLRSVEEERNRLSLRLERSCAVSFSNGNLPETEVIKKHSLWDWQQTSQICVMWITGLCSFAASRIQTTLKQDDILDFCP